MLLLTEMTATNLPDPQPAGAGMSMFAQATTSVWSIIGD